MARRRTNANGPTEWSYIPSMQTRDAQPSRSSKVQIMCVKQPGEATDTKHVRDRVLQEIGCTSTTFIGPTFRPKSKPETHNPAVRPKSKPETHNPAGRPKSKPETHNPAVRPKSKPETHNPAGRPKTKPETPNIGRPKTEPETPKIGRPKTEPETPNIEETLSEFYKELEQIDSTDNADFSNQKAADSKSCEPLETSAEKDQVSVMTKSLDTDFCQNSMRRPARPHWYQNEPYHHRDQRSSVDQMSGGPAHSSYAQNHWHHCPPANNRLPFPRFNEPPFCGPPPHFSPPFPGPPGIAPPHMNDNWNCSDKANQHQQDMCWLPPHDEYNRLPQDCNEWGHYEDGDSNYVNDSLSDVTHLREDFDRHRKYGADKELREQEDPRQPSDQTHGSLVLILLRGLPGSGKSTLATELLSTGPSGLALSTDDYFFSEDGYNYEPRQLGVAHEWNQSRAKEAMLEGRSPIIIDNTNIEAWEMKPYVKMALENGYRIDFVEPDTCWKCDPFELEKRNKHGVPQQKISQMLDRFSFPISVDIVMNSQEPPHVSMRHRPEPQKQERFNSTIPRSTQIHPNK